MDIEHKLGYSAQLSCLSEIVGILLISIDDITTKIIGYGFAVAGVIFIMYFSYVLDHTNGLEKLKSRSK